MGRQIVVRPCCAQVQLQSAARCQLEGPFERGARLEAGVACRALFKAERRNGRRSAAGRLVVARRGERLELDGQIRCHPDERCREAVARFGPPGKAAPANIGGVARANQPERPCRGDVVPSEREQSRNIGRTEVLRPISGQLVHIAAPVHAVCRIEAGRSVTASNTDPRFGRNCVADPDGKALGAGVEVACTNHGARRGVVRSGKATSPQVPALAGVAIAASAGKVLDTPDERGRHLVGDRGNRGNCGPAQVIVRLVEIHRRP